MQAGTVVTEPSQIKHYCSIHANLLVPQIGRLHLNVCRAKFTCIQVKWGNLPQNREPPAQIRRVGMYVVHA